MLVLRTQYPLLPVPPPMLPLLHRLLINGKCPVEVIGHGNISGTEVSNFNYNNHIIIGTLRYIMFTISLRLIGVLYPEFNYRRPPPSYNVSMREHQSISSPPHLSLNGLPAAVAPPPAYRSNSSTRDSSPTQIYSDSLPPIYRTAPRTTSITIDTHL